MLICDIRRKVPDRYPTQVVGLVAENHWLNQAKDAVDVYAVPRVNALPQLWRIPERFSYDYVAAQPWSYFELSEIMPGLDFSADELITEKDRLDED